MTKIKYPDSPTRLPNESEEDWRKRYVKWWHKKYPLYSLKYRIKHHVYKIGPWKRTIERLKLENLSTGHV